VTAKIVRTGYDRSRWRGLWRNQVQEYMTAAIQNIEAIIRYAKGPGKAVMAVSLIGNGISVCPDLFGKLSSILLIKQKYLYWKEMAVQFRISKLVWATAR
jgi:hypothetical protein